ncbi:helix-turn-helix transcriptional regulator [Pseudomonas sp. PB3P13]
MEQWKKSQLQQFSSTTDINSAYLRGVGFANNIGFNYFSFSTTYPIKDKQSKTVSFNNYPTRWNQEYEQKQIRDIDPIVAHCKHSMLPILWTKDAYSNTPALWEALQTHGLQHGWSQALHDEEKGLCSILSLARSHCPVSAMELYENLGYCVLMARHLHTLVEQSLPKHVAEPGLPRLSDREVDVLNLAASGKTAQESARILNLSPRTIHFHIHSAIEKMGVTNKISAIVAAMKAGHLNVLRPADS